MEYNSLKTGETYKIQDLFSKDNKIIIPDLQRDYCWGTKNKDGENLVSAFISNLLKNKDKDLNLGLLYGYEAPLGHIQLCDGQQRITTLFLLLGMLNKRADDAFRRYLISETEEKDDWEPYLQYAIRESSLYFLSDLTRYFFIEGKKMCVSDIKQQSWYFKDYDLDPSIQSMIAAMEIIEGQIKCINCEDFGNHIVENLSFLYYDMENRTKGEETFVVINTTGEPLSATENLKPLLINKQSKNEQDQCAKNWEEWEQFFWKNRGKNDTADNGLKEFFRWIMLLKLDPVSSEFTQIQKDGNFKFDISINFDEINRYFHIVSDKLFSKDKQLLYNIELLSPQNQDGNNQVDWFKVIPVLQYVYRFQNASDLDIQRIVKFYGNQTLINKITNQLYNRNEPTSLLSESIRIINDLPDKDICSILQIENVSKTLISDEVKLKLQILSNHPHRNDVENAFWEVEENKIWRGEIMPLVQWSMSSNGFDFESFKKYSEKFNKVFHDTLEYKELDITRRALLTQELKDYPRIFKGYTNWSFAWDYEDWHSLIFDNVEKFKNFFDALDANNIYEAQEKMINLNPKNKDFDEFVKTPDLLEYCEQKKIQWRGEELGWTLIKGDNARGEYANLKSYGLYLELKNCFPGNYIWFYGKEGSCVAIDETTSRNTWVVDVMHSGNNKYALELHRRNGVPIENTFKEIPQKYGLTWNGKRYEKKDMERTKTIELLKSIVDDLNS